MIDEKVFEQAVQLAAAFVANGDIRLGLDLEDSQGIAMLEDLIPVLCRSLAAAKQVALGAPH